MFTLVLKSPPLNVVKRSIESWQHEQVLFSIITYARFRGGTSGNIVSRSVVRLRTLLVRIPT